MAKEGTPFLHRYPAFKQPSLQERSPPAGSPTSKLSPNLSSSLGFPKVQLCLSLPQLHLSSPLLKYPPPSSCPPHSALPSSGAVTVPLQRPSVLLLALPVLPFPPACSGHFPGT